MATFSELQIRVQRRVIDAPAAVVAEVPGFVNKALRKLQSLRNFQVMKATVTFNTALSTRILGAVPADFKEYRGTPYRLNQFGGSTMMSVAYSEQSIGQTVGEEAEGGSKYIQETVPDASGARNWNIWPLSGGGSDWSGGEYSIVIPYWKYLPNLVADGDSNWFTNNAEDYIVFKATAMGFELDWDLENAQVWEALAKAEYRDVKNTDASVVLSRMESLVPRRGPRSQEMMD